LWQAIRDIAAVVIPATGRTVAVSFDLTGNGVLECVPDELHQALGNLIQNAAEAAPQQGGQLVIEGHQTVGGLEVSVTDNGQGIAQDDRQRIFEPFFSTKGPGRGMGMGLTITRRVIAAAGGEIALETPPGGGVRFVVRLPRRAPVQA
jgi:two-component system NtrC family sensor kinase